MKILVLDNYDSFTYNLVHMIRELGYGVQMEVYRNDKISVAQAATYDKILLSPGPGIPEEAGILIPLIHTLAPQKSILGVCLGHQGIAEAFGGKLYNMQQVQHGIADQVKVRKPHLLFSGLPDQFQICHYHSWAVEEHTLPEQLEVTAVDSEGKVMALAHKTFPVAGVQFHPESVVTEHGVALMKNWLES